jgi:hypothetical protein
VPIGVDVDEQGHDAFVWWLDVYGALETCRDAAAHRSIAIDHTRGRSGVGTRAGRTGSRNLDGFVARRCVNGRARIVLLGRRRLGLRRGGMQGRGRRLACACHEPCASQRSVERSHRLDDSTSPRALRSHHTIAPDSAELDAAEAPH